MYTVLIGKFKEKRRIGRPRSIWRDYIKMHTKERGLEDADWIHMADGTHHWWADMNQGMNHKVSKRGREFPG